jgi:uncharacterized MAPEG superfamily protein
MKPELMYLSWSVLLSIVHMLITVTALFLNSGLMVTVGNRANLPELPGWGGRSVRANANMSQNLVLFAAVVLAVVVTGTTNDMTLKGAQLFFFARIAYAVFYLAGLPWLRTGSWLVSIAGVLLILLQLK